METNLERLDRQLVHVQVELQKLNILIEHLCQDSRIAADKGLIDTIQHHRQALVGSSRKIDAQIERMCRSAS